MATFTSDDDDGAYAGMTASAAAEKAAGTADAVRSDELAVGQRVRDEQGFRATVRYIGRVYSEKAKTADTIYLGVEWDDASRGKHDGSVPGPDGKAIKYFSTAHATSGSFIKPKKVDRGGGLAAALGNRYVTMDAPLVAPRQVFEGAAVQTSRGTKPIEFYGELNIRNRQQLEALTSVTMRNDRVSVAGDKAAIRATAGHLSKLDLQANLLSSWTELVAIAEQMLQLDALALNNNPLGDLPRDVKVGSAFASVVSLNLNECGITSWATIAALEPVLPRVEWLCIAGNDLSDITNVLSAGKTDADDDGAPLLVEGFKSVKWLDVSMAKLSSWAELLPFSTLPSLMTLHAFDNGIRAVLPATAEGLAAAAASAPARYAPLAPLFPKLTELSLVDNAVSAWCDIDAVATFPSLRSLRFSSNPVTAGLGSSEVRIITVARLPNLTELNGSHIKERERIEAEKSYIRRVMRDLKRADDSDAAVAAAVAAPGEAPVAVSKNRDACVAAHPRYDALFAEYGAVLTAVRSSTGAISAEMVSITIQSMAGGSCHIEPVKKKLPAAMLVSRVKQLCERLFKLETELQVLYFKNDFQEAPVILEDDENPLSFYGLCDGAKLMMNETDPKQKEREAEAARARQAQREQEQERQVQQLQALRRAEITADTTAAIGAAAAAGGGGGK